MGMTKRERVLTAFNRQKPDRIPWNLSFAPTVYEMARSKITDLETFLSDSGGFAGIDLWGNIWNVSNPLPKNNDFYKNKFRRYFPEKLPDGTQYYEWGFARVPGNSWHFSRIVSPLMFCQTPVEINNFPFPDVLNADRWSKIESKIKEFRKTDVAIGTDCISLFEMPWMLRGFDNLLADFIVNPEIADALLDWFENLGRELAGRFAALNVDVITFGDDIGMQDRMLMSPDTWRCWIKPRMKRIIEAARKIKPDILIYYDSDGYIEPIIGDLIEIGINILAPLQPECMNIPVIKEKYGNKLAFKGSIGAQSVMPRGTPEDVRQAVIAMIKLFENGGLFLCPSHCLEPDVPWKNIKAFVETVTEYG